MQNNEIWIIDPDRDDQELIIDIMTELGRQDQVRFLPSAASALEHLEMASSAPFIIISELNLPGTNGFELREKILGSHSKKFKSVPFILWSTAASEEQITHAYDLAVHGFFIKDAAYNELKSTFMAIIQYWLKSKMPAKR